MLVKPMGNKVTVKKLYRPSVSTLIEVVRGEDVFSNAEVLAVGPEVRNVQPGQIVYGNLGTALEFEGVYVVPESSIFVILGTTA